MSYRITWTLHIKCFLLTAFIAVVFYRPLEDMVIDFWLAGFMEFPTKDPIINFFLIMLVFAVVITALHEIIHGIFLTAVGGKAKFGFRFIYVYVQETSGLALSRIQYTVVLLTPLLLISLLSSYINGWVGGLILAINFFGSSGDILLALGLLKLDRGARIISRSYGYDIIKKAEITHSM